MRNNIEIHAQIATIWQDTLELDMIPDNAQEVFSLGAGSLAIIRMLNKVEQTFQFKLDIESFFANPTIGGLAQSILDLRNQMDHIVGKDSSTEDAPTAAELRDHDFLDPTLNPMQRFDFAQQKRVTDSVLGGANNIQDVLPLTPLQKGMLFHHQVTENWDAYLMCSVLAFDTHAQVQNYLHAFQSVVDRHQALRTAVVWKGLPEPVQVIWRKALLDVEEPEIDEREGPIVQALLRQFDPDKYYMDLSQAPLIRIIATPDPIHNRWVLLQFSHHLTVDFIGWLKVQREVSAVLNGQLEILHDPKPYRPLVEHVVSKSAEQDYKKFFGEMLGDIDEPTAPFGLIGLHGAKVQLDDAQLSLNDELVVRVRNTAKRLGVSVASLFHVAWARIISRASGSNDIVFGTVMSGRLKELSGDDAALGLYINTLPIRVGCTDTALDNAVRQTHDLLIKLMAYEHVSPVAAQQCSGVQAPTPLFSALLNYYSIGSAVSNENLHNDIGTPLRFFNRTNYPLALSVRDQSDSITLMAQIAKPHEAHRICAYMQTALEEMVELLEKGPGTPVEDVNILPLEERHLQLVSWNDTATKGPVETSIQMAFEQQVILSPGAIALEFGTDRISYRALNERANALAHHLRKKGVGRDVTVGLCLDRGPNAIITLLAILKAGGAVVPLDPNYPHHRLTQMVQSAKPAVLVTHSDLKMVLPTFDGTIVFLDTHQTEIAGESTADPDSNSKSDDLAYVMFTSGTTSIPKGVCITHGNVLRLTVTPDYVHLDPHETVLHFASLSFDAAIWEIWGSLLNGASLAVCAPGHQSMEALGRTITSHKVTTLFLTTAMFHQMVDRQLHCLTGLRQVIAGGETLSPTFARRFLDGVPEATLINGYGPTENTTFSCSYAMTHGSEIGETVLIGTPIRDSQAYILDDNMHPLPIGATGELYLGGRGVVQGYLNDPEQTAQRFVVDPFNLDPHARLYRSGDLGRYMPDGNIEFLGRTDTQVKLRGFRIELGEIETVLREFANIRQAIVHAREDTPGDKRLVAYVVVDLKTEPMVDTWRTTLRARLPSHMCPSAFVVLDRLPLTPNAKVNRNALPAPDMSSVMSGNYVDPDGALEKDIARIWAGVLGVDRIGRNDNFFDHGGHSLLAAKVISDLQDQLDLVVPILTIFRAPTVAEFVLQITHTGEDHDHAEPGQAWFNTLVHDLRAIVQTWKGTPLAQGGMMIGHNLDGARKPLFWCCQAGHEMDTLALNLGPNQPLIAMRSGHFVIDYTPENLDVISDYYARQMMEIQPEGSFILGGNCQGASLIHLVAHRLLELGRDVALLVLMEQSRIRSFPGEVALIYGQDSTLNPFNLDADISENFDAAYTGGHTSMIITGGHGQFFKPANIQSLVDKLQFVLLLSSDREWLVEQINSMIKNPKNRSVFRRPQAALKASATWKDIRKTLKVTRFSVTSPPNFDDLRYLENNLDVKAAIRPGRFKNGFEHYVKFGQAEGRKRPIKAVVA